MDVGDFFATISIHATHQWALGLLVHLGHKFGGPIISIDSILGAMRGVGRAG